MLIQDLQLQCMTFQWWISEVQLVCLCDVIKQLIGRLSLAETFGSSTDGFCMQDHTLILDPPSIIFISRLHLISVARRKSLAADARAAASSKQAARIPPPVELPDWAKQHIQQQQQQSHQPNSQQLKTSSSQCARSNGLPVCSVHTSSSSSSNDNSKNSSRVMSGQETSCSDRCSSISGSDGRTRRLEDAPELLCCPITGQVSYVLHCSTPYMIIPTVPIVYKCLLGCQAVCAELMLGCCCRHCSADNSSMLPELVFIVMRAYHGAALSSFVHCYCGQSVSNILAQHQGPATRHSDSDLSPILLCA